MATHRFAHKAYYRLGGRIAVETDSAWLVIIVENQDMVVKIWLPKSECNLAEDKLHEGKRHGLFDTPAWLIEKHRLDNYVDE